MLNRSKEFFLLSRVREPDIVSLPDMLGHKPTAQKKNDTDSGYRSPLRQERTTRFHVGRTSNEWYGLVFKIGKESLNGRPEMIL